MFRIRVSARSLILITLGVVPPVPHPKLSVSRPAQYPPTGRGYSIDAQLAVSFNFKQTGDVQVFGHARVIFPWQNDDG
jgi:hypothetical protein